VAGLQTKTGAAWLSVGSNALLVLLKLAAGLFTGSISVLSEAAHSAVDLFAAAIACFAVRVAERPADPEHPYGHGKVENLSAVIEAALIFGAAAYIVYEAYGRLFAPPPIRRVDLAFGVMGVSAVLNWLVSRHLLHVARKTDSPALLADAHHLSVDVYTSAGVMGTLLLMRITGQPLLDPIIALLLAGLIVKVAWELTQEAGGGLLDTRLPPAEIGRLRAVLDGDSRVIGYHRVRARRSGAHRHIDLHLLVDPEMSLRDAHHLAEEVEDRIRAELAHVSIVTHVEPATEEELAVTDSEPGIWKGKVREEASNVKRQTSLGEHPDV
jgi:cation diffusion facilitator family transporter